MLFILRNLHAWDYDFLSAFTGPSVTRYSFLEQCSLCQFFFANMWATLLRLSVLRLKRTNYGAEVSIQDNLIKYTVDNPISLCLQGFLRRIPAGFAKVVGSSWFYLRLWRPTTGASTRYTSRSKPCLIFTQKSSASNYRWA